MRNLDIWKNIKYDVLNMADFKCWRPALFFATCYLSLSPRSSAEIIITPIWLQAIFTCLLLIGSFVFSDAFLESFLGKLGDKSNPDVLCIMEHCGSQSVACAANRNCRENMECMIKCGLTNHGCMYECMNTYEDKIFDAMMKYLVDDYHCMDLTPPDPSFRCSPPKQLVKNFTLSQLQGSWWIVRG